MVTLVFCTDIRISFYIHIYTHIQSCFLGFFLHVGELTCNFLNRVLRTGLESSLTLCAASSDLEAAGISERKLHTVLEQSQ